MEVGYEKCPVCGLEYQTDYFVNGIKPYNYNCCSKECARVAFLVSELSGIVALLRDALDNIREALTGVASDVSYIKTWMK